MTTMPTRPAIRPLMAPGEVDKHSRGRALSNSPATRRDLTPRGVHQVLRLLKRLRFLAVACAVLAGLSLSAQAQAQALFKVSGDNQTGVINTALANPFVVASDPSPVVVTWSIVSGGGTLSATSTLTSLINGQAQTTLTLGPDAGPVTVRAAVGANGASGASVIFTATATASAPAPVAQATEGVRQAAALGTVALTTTSVQTTNIGLRLNALRRGAQGIAMSGVALNIDGQPVPVGALTSLGGGASADRSSMLGRLGMFANGQGSFGDQDATSREPGFDFHTAGLTVGGDYRFTDKFLLGMALGYLRTKATFDASAGDSKINGYSVSAYGNYYIWDKLYVDGIATFGRNTYDTTRNIAQTTATAQGDTEGTQVAISVSSGYNFSAGAFTFGPTGRVNYVRVHIDGFRERAAEPFNLKIGSQTVESVTTGLGGQVTYALSMPWGVLTPLARFEWEHEYKGNSRTVTASVLADPTTTAAVQTNGPDRDYVNLGVGLSATFKGGVSAFVAYDAVTGRAHFTSHAFNAGLRFEF